MNISRLVLLPSLPLFFLPIPIPTSMSVYSDYAIYAILSCFSALIWAMLVGIAFRREKLSNQ